MANFTGRAEEQQTFRHLIEAPAGTPLPVVMFYGVGGIGKTWLLRRLQHEHAIPRSLPTAHIDFSRDPGVNGERFCADAALALATIRQQFKVSCPRFDLAYAMLLHKQGAGSEPTLKGSADAEMTWNLIVDISLSPLPASSVLATIVKRATKSIAPHFKNTALYKWLATANGEKDIPLLTAQTEQEITDSLALRLRDDLTYALHPREGKACRAVVFLDTYESLTDNISSDAQQKGKQRWVRDLCGALNTAGVLFVIAGQNKLTWHEVDPAWAEPSNLEQHPVGGLSASDSRRFLEKCGITDSELQEAILRFSRDDDGGHHTWSLGLCADVCTNAPGTTAETFALPPGDLNALALRFLKSLHSPEHEEWIKGLAQTPRFDETAARALHGGTPIQQNTAWRNLLDYSFITPTDSTGWFTIRLQMREALHRVAKPVYIRSQHEFWRAHWQSRQSTPDDDIASLAWFHHWYLSPEEALKDWNALILATRIGGRTDMLSHYRLLNWWESIDLEFTNYSHSIMYSAQIFRAIELFEASLGDREANLHQAIDCYNAVLCLYTEATFPQDWATVQNNLANIYSNLPSGDRDANLRQAINCYNAALRVRTVAKFPQDWAMTQNNLANAYLYLPSGNRDANLRQAIACHEAALRVRTEDASPQQWAATQINMANVYLYLPSGDHDANLRQAIACYEAALHVYTEAVFPQQWAGAQNNLATAYLSLPSGDDANLYQAIACYEAALRVRTVATCPQEWATTKCSLANAYCLLLSGDRDANLKQAITCYEAALRVYTETAFPQDWAMTQNNLAAAYTDLRSGDRNSNLKKAITYNEAALRVYTAAAFPQDWAATQNNLATAYLDLPSGDRDANVKQAIACFESALHVYTEADFPQQWAMTNANLGIASSSVEDWHQTRAAWGNAQRGFRAVGMTDEAAKWEHAAASLPPTS